MKQLLCMLALVASLSGCSSALPMRARIATSKATCRYDLDAMHALPPLVFDQDPKGWRSIGEREGCELAAADLIAAYRDRNPTAGKDEPLLFWHEGQLRAEAGQYDRAAALFFQSHAEGDEVWNLYVDASIAFLKHDRPALESARRTLASFPKPPQFDDMQPLYPGFRGPPPTWPPHLDGVDNLLRCFDRPYAEAYGCGQGNMPSVPAKDGP